MFNTTFKLALESIDDDGNTASKDVDVIIQEISPFKFANIMSGAVNVTSSQYLVGSLAEDFLTDIVVSPKNLKQQIEEASNATEAISALVREVRTFCNSPKKYVLLQKQSEIKSESVGNGITKSDANGS